MAGRGFGIMNERLLPNSKWRPLLAILILFGYLRRTFARKTVFYFDV
jgi:hypothetical protein